MGKVVKAALTAAAVVFLTVTTFGAATFAPIFASGALASLGVAMQYAIMTFATTLISAGIGKLTSKGVEANSRNFGTKVTSRGALQARQIIYGKTRVGGTITFLRTTGTDNNKLSMYIVFAGHEIQSFEKIYLDDTQVTFTNYDTLSGAGTDNEIKRITNSAFVNTNNDNSFANGSLVRFTLADGSQTSRDALAAQTHGNSIIDTDFKLTDCAYMYVEMIYDPEKMPQLPNITAEIKGKKVYDPRDTNQTFGTESTYTWSNNPALHVLDYLTNTTYGLKAFESEINTGLGAGGFSAAANTCEQDVTTNSITDDRYTANGFTNMAAQGTGIIEGLLSSCGGKLTYNNGRFNIFVAAAQSATLTITDEKVLSPIVVTRASRSNENFNRVKAAYVDSAVDYTGLDTPVLSNSTFLTEDTPSGESSANYQKLLEVQLPYTTNIRTAERLSKIALQYKRKTEQVSFLTTVDALRLQPCDYVRVTNERLDYSSKLFEVMSTQLEFITEGDVPFAACRLTLKDISSDVFDFAVNDYVTPVDQGSSSSVPIGDFTMDAPSSLSLTKVLTKEGTTSKINIEASWTNSTSPYLFGTEIEYKLSTESDYKSFAVGAGVSKALIPNVAVGEIYNVRVRHFSTEQVFSSYATASAFTVTASSSAPSAPTSLTVTSGRPMNMALSWINPNNSDLKAVKVYRKTSDVTPTGDSDGLVQTIYGNNGSISQVLFGKQDGLTAGTTYYFWVRAINHSDVHSAFVGSVNGTFNNIGGTDLADSAVFEGYFRLEKTGNTNAPDTSTFNSNFGRNPKNGDIVVVVRTDTNPDQSKAFQHDGSNFNEITNFITGDLLVDGTITGDKIQAASVSADRVDSNFISTLNLLTTSATITNDLAVGTGNNIFKATSGTGIQVGHATFSSAPFRVTEAGVLTATGATITGNITASAINLDTATISGTLAAGNIDVSGVITAGSLLTDSATIGNDITIGTGNSVFKASSSGIQLGHATFGSAPFRVTPAGALTATSATITGNITANSLDVIEANIQNLTLTLGGGILQDGSSNNLTVRNTINPDFPVDGLSHYFPLNGFSDPADTTPADVIDVVGGVTGTITGSNGSFGEDSPAGRAYINGAATGITLLSDSQADTWQAATGNYSVSFWFKSTATGEDTLARIIGRDASDYWTIALNQNQSSPQDIILFTDTENQTAADKIVVDQWHHITLAVTGTTKAELYVDGDLVITDTNINYATSSRPIVLGCNTEGSINTTADVTFGKYSDVRFYTKALTAIEANALYLNPTGGLPAKLEGDLFVTQTITADKLKVNNLAAVSANLGDITAGSLNINSSAFAVTTAGVLTATSGTVGGVTLGTNKLHLGTGTYNNSNTAFYVDTSNNFSLGSKLSFDGTDLTINGGGTFTGSLSVGSSNNIFKADSTNGISLGHATFASAPFRVTLGGALTATNATITGDITANSLNVSSATITGTISASNLDVSGIITAGNILTDSVTIANDITIGSSNSVFKASSSGIQLGHATFSSAPFRVTPAGVLTATSGTIGGFTLGTSKLTAGSGSSSITLDTANGIFLGNATQSSAPFNVSQAGKLTTKDLQVQSGADSNRTVRVSPSSNDNIFFSAGSSDPQLAPFKVSVDTSGASDVSVVELDNVKIRQTDGTLVFDSAVGFTNAAFTEVAASLGSPVSTLQVGKTTSTDAVKITLTESQSLTVKASKIAVGFAVSESSLSDVLSKFPTKVRMRLMHSTNADLSSATQLAALGASWTAGVDRVENQSAATASDEFEVITTVESEPGFTFFYAQVRDESGDAINDAGSFSITDTDTYTGSTSGTDHYFFVEIAGTGGSNAASQLSIDNTIANRLITITGTSFYPESSGDAGTTGDITQISANDGLSGGGTAGNVGIAVDATVLRTTGNQSIAGTKTFTGTLAVSGDLQVTGSSTTLNSTNTTITDTIIELNSGISGSTNSNDIGLILKRGSSQDNIFIGFDESTDKVRLATTSATGSSSGNLTLTDAGLRISDLTLGGTLITATGTELNYVDGVTSAIQTQLNAKQATITGAATTLVSSNLTASRALVSNSSGKVGVSAVTSTELGYLDGVTSAIQTQLDAKLPLSGGTMSGNLNMNDNNINNVQLISFSNEELTTFTGAYQFLVDANDSDNDIATHGDFTGGYPFGIYFTGDGGNATTTIGSGLVKVWHTGHFKKAHIDYFVGLYDTGVTTTEYDYLDGVTSNIQTQLDAKQATLTSSTNISVGTITSSGDVGFAVNSGGNAYIVIDRSASNRRGALVFSTAATNVTASPPVNTTIDWSIGVSDSDEVSGDKFYIRQGDTNASGSALLIDSSNNATFAGTIDSGAITAAGQITSGGTMQADLLKGSTSANNNYLNFNDDTTTYGDSSNTTTVASIADVAIATNTNDGGGGDFIVATGSTGTKRFEVSSAGAVTHNNAYTFPTADGSANQVLQTDGSGSITFADASGSTSASDLTSGTLADARLSTNVPLKNAVTNTFTGVQNLNQANADEIFIGSTSGANASLGEAGIVINTSTKPQILFDGGADSNLDISVPTGEILQIGHWDVSANSATLQMSMETDGDFNFEGNNIQGISTVSCSTVTATSQITATGFRINGTTATQSIDFNGSSDLNYRKFAYSANDNHHVTNRHTDGDLILMSNNGTGGGETERLRLTSNSGTGLITVSNANLNLNSNNISNVGDLHFESATPKINFTDTTNDADASIEVTDAGSIVFNADVNSEVANTIIDFKIDNATQFYMAQDGGFYRQGTGSAAKIIDANTGNLTNLGSIEALSGNLTITEVTGASAYTKIRKTNTGSNLAIVSQESIYMMLDENNNQTNRSFQIRTNSGDPASGSSLFIVNEDGTATLTSTLTAGGIVFPQSSTNKILWGGDDGYSANIDYTDNGSGDHFLAINTTHNSTTSQRIKVHAQTGVITFNGAYAFPTSDGSANQVLTTNGSGTLSFADAGGGTITAATNMSNDRVLTASGSTTINGESLVTISSAGVLDLSANTNVPLTFTTGSGNNARISMTPNAQTTNGWNFGVLASDYSFTFYDIANATTAFQIYAGAGTNRAAIGSYGLVAQGLSVGTHASRTEMIDGDKNIKNFEQLNAGASTTVDDMIVQGSSEPYMFLDTRSYQKDKGHYASSAYIIGGESGSSHSVVVYFDNTNVFVDGVLKLSNCQADQIYTLASSDLSAFSRVTADRPFVVHRAGSISHMPMNERLAGNTLMARASRSWPIDIFIYSPYTSVTVEIYRHTSGIVDASSSSSSHFLYTTTIAKGAGFQWQEDVHNGGASVPSSGNAYYVVKADGKVCAEWVPDVGGNDRMLMPPASMEVLMKSSTSTFGVSDGTTQTDIENKTGTATLSRDKSGKHGVWNVAIADGAGGDAEYALGLEWLSDHYLYANSSISNFRAAFYRPTNFKVLDASGNVLYTTFANASKDSPVLFEQGASSGSGSNLSTAGPFRFVADNPFHLVCQESSGDDECVMLGALNDELAHHEQRFDGGNINQDIRLDDNLNIHVGTSNDLSIFHDTQHSFIHHSGTGALKLKEGSADAVVIDGGTVNINHSGTTKLITTANGIATQNGADIDMDNSSSGQIKIDGNGYGGGIALGSSNMAIYHNSSSRGLVLGTNETERLTISGSGTFTFHSNNLQSIGNISATGFSTNGTTGTFSNTVGTLPLVTSTAYDYVAKFESTDSGAAIIIEDNNSTNNGNRVGVSGNTMEFFTDTTKALSLSASNDATFEGSITCSDENTSFVIEGDSSNNTYLKSNGQIRVRPEGTTVNKIVMDSSYIQAPELRIGSFQAVSGPSGKLFFGDHGDDLDVDITGFSGGSQIYMTDGTIFLYGTSNSTCEFKFTSGGDFHADNNITAFSSTIGSDIKLKENISTIDNALDLVTKIEGVNFTWKRDKKKSKGFIAQQIQEVMPELVEEVETLGTDGDTHLTVNYEAVIPVLVEAIKEQQKEIEALKKDSHTPKGLYDMEGIDELVARIKRLEDGS